MMNTKSDPLEAKAVSVCEAAGQAANWRTFAQNNPLPNGITAPYGFNIPIGDLQQIMDYAVSGARVYAALKTPTDITSLHLYVVPMDGEGNDMLTVNGGSTIYDTTTPCPVICGNPSVMNDDQIWQAECGKHS